MARPMTWHRPDPADPAPMADDKGDYLKLLADAVLPDWVPLERMLDRLERRGGVA